MTANTGTFNNLTASRIVGNWTPVTPMANYRRLHTDYHTYRVQYMELKDYAAADTVSSGDTYTWTTNMERRTGGLVILSGVFVIFPSDISEDADDYWTVSCELDGTEVATRTTANGANAGQVWEVTRTGSAANRAGSSETSIEIIFTAAVAGTAPALQSGIVVAIVTQEAE